MATVDRIGRSENRYLDTAALFIGPRPKTTVQGQHWDRLASMIELDLEFGVGIAGITERDRQGAIVDGQFYLSDATIRALLKVQKKYPHWPLVSSALQHAEPATRRRFTELQAHDNGSHDLY